MKYKCYYTCHKKKKAMEQVEKISPLAAIRIVKDMNRKEFAQYFMCTAAYISLVEKNQRQMTLRTLSYGLQKLNISLSDYFILEELRDGLVNSGIPKPLIYRCMLSKSIGIINHDLKEKAEEVINLTLQTKVK